MKVCFIWFMFSFTDWLFLVVLDTVSLKNSFLCLKKAENHRYIELLWLKLSLFYL